MDIATVDDLAGLFFEAAQTERKLPRAYDLRVKGCWPEVAPDPQLAYGYHAAEYSIGPATSKEVTNYDKALRLTMMLDDSDRKLVWAVAHSAARRARGPHWARIGRMMGVHAQTVKRRFERAILGLWYKLS